MSAAALTAQRDRCRFGMTKRGFDPDARGELIPARTQDEDFEGREGVRYVAT